MYYVGRVLSTRTRARTRVRTQLSCLLKSTSLIVRSHAHGSLSLCELRRVRNASRRAERVREEPRNPLKSQSQHEGFAAAIDPIAKFRISRRVWDRSLSRVHPAAFSSRSRVQDRRLIRDLSRMIRREMINTRETSSREEDRTEPQVL